MIAALRRRRDALAPTTRGMLAILLAMFLFVCMDATAKALMQRLPVAEVIWARFASQTLLMVLIFLPSLRERLRTRHLGLQISRSAMLFCATCFFFTSLNFMELAETVAIFEIAPLLITVLGAIVLREHVGPRRWAAVIVGLIGALIIIRPGLDVFQLASLLPMAAAFCFASYQIATRYLGADEPIWTTMLYTTGVGTLLASLALPFVWQTPSLGDLGMMTIFGVFGMTGHFCLVYALSQAPASVLAPFNYAGFVWAALMGFVVFAEVPDAITLLGASIIIGAGVYVWHREQVREAA
ncbi:MAG: DMT family transporter [Pseudomonadota bacterium]